MYNVSFTRDEMLRMARAMAPTNKIDAIKFVRQCTGMGLKEAKDFVEVGCYDFRPGDQVTFLNPVYYGEFYSMDPTDYNCILVSVSSRNVRGA